MASYLWSSLTHGDHLRLGESRLKRGWKKQVQGKRLCEFAVLNYYLNSCVFKWEDIKSSQKAIQADYILYEIRNFKQGLGK